MVGFVENIAFRPGNQTFLLVRLVIMVLTFLATEVASLVTSDDGLQTGSPFRRRACPWTDIERIHLKRTRLRFGSRIDVIIRPRLGHLVG